jgi:hypothetical protein
VSALDFDLFRRRLPQWLSPTPWKRRSSPRLDPAFKNTLLDCLKAKGADRTQSTPGRVWDVRAVDETSLR